MTEISFTYFKPSGKYYTSASVPLTWGGDWWDHYAWVENTIYSTEKLPGLSSRYWDGPILVEIPGGPPHLFPDSYSHEEC